MIFESVCHFLCALNIRAESRNSIYFFLKPRYIPPLYCKAKNRGLGWNFRLSEKICAGLELEYQHFCRILTATATYFFLRGEISTPNLCFFALQYNGGM